MKTVSVVERNPQHLDDVTLQAQLDAAQPGDTITLWPAQREIQGPIFIRKPIQIDGQGATLWNHHGPVVVIRSEQVQLRNLSIEVTNEQAMTSPEIDRCAIVAEPIQSVSFENIRVRGNTIGLPHDEGEWAYPQAVIHLERLARSHRYEYELQMIAPEPGWIVSRIDGVSVNPCQLVKGKNTIKVTIDSPVFNDTLLLGDLLFAATDSSVIRWIGLNAYVSSEAVASSDALRVLWQPSEEVEGALLNLNKAPTESPAEAPTELPTGLEEAAPESAPTQRPSDSKTPQVSQALEVAKSTGSIQYLPPTLKDQTPKGTVWNPAQLPLKTETAQPLLSSESPTLPSIFCSVVQPSQGNPKQLQPPGKDPLSLPKVFGEDAANASPSSNKTIGNLDSASQNSDKDAPTHSAPIPDIFT